MNNILRIISTALILVCVSSCTTLNLAKKEPRQTDASLLAISVRSKSAGMSGRGLMIRLENIETHQQYDSKSLSVMSKEAVIQNLPAGEYQVVYVEIPIGDLVFMNRSEPLKEYFGTVRIEPNRKYYLGSYICKFSGTLSNRVFSLMLENQSVSDKLVSFVAKTGWEEEGFVLLEPNGVSVRIN